MGGGSVTAQPVQAYAPPVAQGTVVASGGKNDPPPAYGGPVAAEMARAWTAGLRWTTYWRPRRPRQVQIHCCSESLTGRPRRSSLSRSRPAPNRAAGRPRSRAAGRRPPWRRRPSRWQLMSNPAATRRRPPRRRRPRVSRPSASRGGPAATRGRRGSPRQSPRPRPTCVERCGLMKTPSS